MLGQSWKSHELFRRLDAANETGHRLCTVKMMCCEAVIFKTRGRKCSLFYLWVKWEYSVSNCYHASSSISEKSYHKWMFDVLHLPLANTKVFRFVCSLLLHFSRSGRACHSDKYIWTEMSYSKNQHLILYSLL